MRWPTDNNLRLALSDTTNNLHWSLLATLSRLAFEERPMQTTWRKEITAALGEVGLDWSDVRTSTFQDGELDCEFYSGYGVAEGCAFTLWTDERVFFPVVYDGAEWVTSVPRNPTDEKTSHIGGQ